jgi:hypothetical protein
MSAGLTDSDSMFSVRDTPWHGLGAVLDRPPDRRRGDRGVRARLGRGEGAHRDRSRRDAERRLVDSALRGFTTRHGDFDVVLMPDGTSGYDEIIVTATPETVPGTGIVVPVASAETILHSKATAGRPKDRAVIDSMREALGLAD